MIISYMIISCNVVQALEAISSFGFRQQPAICLAKSDVVGKNGMLKKPTTNICLTLRNTFINRKDVLLTLVMVGFTSSDHKEYKLWSCQNLCDALSYLLDNIYIKICNKLYRQIVGIPMGTNCAPLVADLFLFGYERDFMTSLSGDDQADIIEAFNPTSRYLDDLLDIDNPYFEGMVNQIYPPELQLNKANTSDTEVPFWIYIFLFLMFFFSSKIYDKRDDFDFDIVIFLFWMAMFRVVLLMESTCIILNS